MSDDLREQPYSFIVATILALGYYPFVHAVPPLSSSADDAFIYHYRGVDTLPINARGFSDRQYKSSSIRHPTILQANSRRKR